MIRWPRSRKAPKLAPVPPADDDQVRSLAPGTYEISPALTALAGPNSKQGQAIHQTAGELIYRHLNLGRRGVAVCGPAAGAGVSFVAANLAVALAQLGVSTVLVDANLRTPSLETFVKPGAPTPGLQHLLREGLDRSEITHEQVLPNLSLVYAGGSPPDVAELMAGDRFRGFIRSCLRDYDCTIVDTPPANRWADARAAAVAVGYALLVARRGASYVDDVAQLSGELAQDGVKLVGAVLNGA